MRRQIVCSLLLSILLLFGLMVGTSTGMTYSGEGQKVLKLKLGSQSPSKDITAKAKERFAAKMRERTNGKIEITCFHEGQLGKWQQMLESIKTGSMAMMISTGGASKTFDITGLPYLFTDGDHATRVLDGEIREEWAKKHLEKTGIYIFGWLYRGFRQCTFTKVPVRTPADMKGMKFRVPQSFPLLETFRAIGAQPTPIAMGELYLALRQGVVDGQENPLGAIISSNFWEVQKYLVLTSHAFTVQWAHLSGAVWESLTPETKKVWLDTWKEVAEEVRKEVDTQDQADISLWKSKGGIVIEPDVEAFREATKDVWKKFASDWEPGLYERIKAQR
jgi:tripartite ATP-independent transporter DctP family solute receptor